MIPRVARFARNIEGPSGQILLADFTITTKLLNATNKGCVANGPLILSKFETYVNSSSLKFKLNLSLYFTTFWNILNDEHWIFSTDRSFLVD